MARHLLPGPPGGPHLRRAPSWSACAPATSTASSCPASPTGPAWRSTRRWRCAARSFLPPRVGPADYPAPVVLTEADLRSALAGSLVTKVVYLEDPDKAVPAATPPGGPNEGDLPPGRDLLDEARDLGRPMLVVRFGGRIPPPDELVYGSVPGTILMPGDQTLPLPRVGPCLPWAGCGFYDPITRPASADGRMLPRRRRPRPARRHRPRRPSCTASTPRTRSANTPTRPAGAAWSPPTSLPLLAALRRAAHRVPLGRYEAAVGVGDTHSASGQTLMEQRTPSLQNQQYAEMKAIISREKPSGELSSQGVGRPGARGHAGRRGNSTWARRRSSAGTGRSS